MGDHPYRTPATPPREPARPCLEDRCVELVLLAVGVLGIAIGVMKPERAVELTAGVFLVVFVLKGGSWRRPRSKSGP